MKRSTKFAVSVLIGIGILAVALLFLNNFLEGKIKNALEKNLDQVNASYEKVDVKLLNRKAEVINAFVQLRDKTFKVDTILLNDIGLWDYITDKDIIVEELKISSPVVKVYKSSGKKQDSAKQEGSSKFNNKILVKNVKVNKGSFRIFEDDTSKHKLFALLNDLNLENVRINSESLKEAVPFEYELGLLDIDTIFFNLDEQHEMHVGNFSIDEDKVLIRDFSILPKYSKEGHQKTIEVEKDRYDLKIDSVQMNNFSWSVQNDSLKIQNSFTGIHSVNFQIYRDKLLPDDETFKPLYSRMIRNLPILLELDSIKVSNMYIKYEENIHADREAGVVEFSNLNGSIKNITNINMNREDFPKTLIDVNADFMKTAPLKVDWEFDISNKSDRFHINGEMGRLAAEQMNKFLRPAMNVEASGEILNMYFNFYGNNTQGSGDMRLEYKDFKVEVLRKDGKRKNKIISALANLIVKNKALNEKANYKEISFTRDKTKSFWNYFWNLIKNGALKAFL